jgi:hypothetical protein
MTTTTKVTREWVAAIGQAHRTLDAVGNTDHQGASVWAAQSAGRRLFVARDGKWVEVKAVNIRHHRNRKSDLSRTVDLVEVGRSYPMGDYRTTPEAVIDGVTYRLTMPWSYPFGPETITEG